MSSFKLNINEVYRKLKGCSNKTLNIPFIETLNGTYHGKNILEGFRSNTELLCKEKSSSNESEFSGLGQNDYIRYDDPRLRFQYTRNEHQRFENNSF